jgi:hypothetical protein
MKKWFALPIIAFAYLAGANFNLLKAKLTAHMGESNPAREFTLTYERTTYEGQIPGKVTMAYFAQKKNGSSVSHIPVPGERKSGAFVQEIRLFDADSGTVIRTFRNAPASRMTFHLSGIQRLNEIRRMGNSPMSASSGCSAYLDSSVKAADFAGFDQINGYRVAVHRAKTKSAGKNGNIATYTEYLSPDLNCSQVKATFENCCSADAKRTEYKLVRVLTHADEKLFDLSRYPDEIQPVQIINRIKAAPENKAFLSSAKGKQFIASQENLQALYLQNR